MAVKIPSRALKKECGAILESMKVEQPPTALLTPPFLRTSKPERCVTLVTSQCVILLLPDVCVFVAAMERVSDDVRERRLLGQGCFRLHPRQELVNNYETVSCV